MLHLLVAATMQGAPPIELGPGAFTFPQIAATLGRPGSPTICVGMENRAAVVHLKGRSLENAERLLARALHVRFRTDDQGRRLMEADPQATARDAKWLATYEAAGSAAYRDYLASFFNPPYAYRAHAEAKADYEANQRRMGEYVRRLAEESKTAESDPGYRKLLDAGTRIGERMNLHLWAATRIHPNLDWPRLRTGGAFTTVPASQIGQRTSAPAEYFLGGPISEKLAVFDTAAIAMIFSPASESVETHVWACGPTVSHEVPGGLAVDLHPEPLGETFAQFGPEAVAELAKGKAETETFLRTPEAQTPLKADSDKQLSGLSQVVERYCRQLGREAIFEIQPIRDGYVSFGDQTLWPAMGSCTMASAFGSSIRVGAAVNERTEWFIARWAEAHGRPHDPASLRKLMALGFERRAPWQLSQVDGVLIVDDLMGFLDRRFTFPLAAFLRLDPPAPGQQWPLLTDLLAYAKALTPEQNAMWVRGGVNWFRGVDLDVCTRAYPFFRVLAQLPDNRRDALFDSLVSGGTGDVSPSSVGSAGDFVSSLSSLRLYHLEMASPRAAAATKDRSFRMTVVHSPTPFEILRIDWSDPSAGAEGGGGASRILIQNPSPGKDRD